MKTLDDAVENYINKIDRNYKLTALRYYNLLMFFYYMTYIFHVMACVNLELIHRNEDVYYNYLDPLYREKDAYT